MLFCTRSVRDFYFYISFTSVKYIKLIMCFLYLNIYRTLLLRIEHCVTEKSKHRLPIFIYIYFFFLFFLYFFLTKQNKSNHKVISIARMRGKSSLNASPFLVIIHEGTQIVCSVSTYHNLRKLHYSCKK